MPDVNSTSGVTGVTQGENMQTPGSLPKYSVANLPPAGDEHVGEFFYQFFENSLKERQRLNLEERWFENHRLFRASKMNPRMAYDARDSISPNTNRHRIPINLFFANVQRTVANITARAPTADVVIIDGNMDGTDLILSSKIKTWWNETEQGVTLSRSGQNMELYGITIEKAVYNIAKKRMDIVVLDPYAFLPAPGYYDDINDAPYLIHMYPDDVESIEKMYGAKPGSVEKDDVYSILGENREDNRPLPSGFRFGAQNYPGNYASTFQATIQDKSRRNRALVMEIWVRDTSLVDVEEEVPNIDPVTGRPGTDVTGGQVGKRTVQKMKYPGGIRVITLTNHGKLVLEDKPNPNVNLNLPEELYTQSYLCERFPFFKVNSYDDTTSLWGFSSIEQVGDIMGTIGEILSRVAFYLARVATPILLIPKDSGITKQMITNRPGLVLQPWTTAVSQGIRFLQVPNLPSNYFEILNVYTKYFDRISQIEDADRGAIPDRVVSGAAIQSLQERGAVLIGAKIRGVDTLVRERCRCLISFFQNFGVEKETLTVQDKPIEIRGVDLIGRRYNFIVESGSTVAKTSMQVQEQAVLLYDKAAIDRIALLETLNFPKWREVVERVGEGQLSQAIDILIQAGMPEDQAVQLRQQLAQRQGGPGVGNRQGGNGKGGGNTASTNEGTNEMSSPTQIRGAMRGK